MEATHVRFAKAVLDLANISDAQDYYAGAVYPDSRFFTGIDRELVHPREFQLIKSFEDKTDFEKGWMTHAYYDDVTNRHFGRWFDYENDPQTQEQWLSITAVKLLEEIMSIRDLQEDIQLLISIKTPSGAFQEKRDLLEEYYQMQRTLYAQRPSVVDDFATLAKRLSPETWPSIRERALELQQDQDMMSQIECLHDEIVKTIV